MDRPRAKLREALIDWCVLGAEASLVLPLRLLRIGAMGEGAREEARLMVSEKIEAQVMLVRRVAGGTIGSDPGNFSRDVARHYLGYVRANRRRLVASFWRSRGNASRD